jgi:cytochrome oxidase Cu insertion factor (SCO1/SenC/PrrC family)
MRLGAVGLLASLLTLGVLVAMGRGPFAAGSGRALRPSEDVRGLAIPEFTLVDQAGRKVTRDALLGKVTVMDFFFSHCPFACPELTAKMADLTVALRDVPVSFVSISVDPQRDTPDRLAEYARENKADTRVWTFLTGEMATVRDIVSTNLKFLLEDDTSRTITLPDGSSMSNITHPTRFVLVGPNAEVLDIFGSDDLSLEALKARARDAARALSR